jgi:acyl dehydratase
MTGDISIPDEAKKMIGKGTTPQSFEITKKDIRRAAQAMALGKELNPLYVDEEYAKKTKCGGTIAPPGFSFSVSPMARYPKATFGRMD